MVLSGSWWPSKHRAECWVLSSECWALIGQPAQATWGSPILIQAPLHWQLRFLLILTRKQPETCPLAHSGLLSSRSLTLFLSQSAPPISSLPNPFLQFAQPILQPGFPKQNPLSPCIAIAIADEMSKTKEVLLVACRVTESPQRFFAFWFPLELAECW